MFEPSPDQTLEQSLERIKKEPHRHSPYLSTAVWNCIFTNEHIGPEWVKGQNLWCDLAKQGDWRGLLGMVTKDEDTLWDGFVNGVELVDPDAASKASGYTALHQVALHGAPVEVVEALVILGAFRQVRTTDGKNQRPIDIAQEKGHTHLYEILTPQNSLPSISTEDMVAIEKNLINKVIKVVAKTTVKNFKLRFPQVDVLREIQPGNEMQIQIIGESYATWTLRFENETLVSKSWVRDDEGSAKLYYVTPRGVKLVQKGFFKRIFDKL